MKIHKREWFKIGKKIYRDDNGCNCNDCQEVRSNGLVIFDQHHADYLFDCAQNEMDIDYRDVL